MIDHSLKKLNEPFIIASGICHLIIVIDNIDTCFSELLRRKDDLALKVCHCIILSLLSDYFVFEFSETLARLKFIYDQKPQLQYFVHMRHKPSCAASENDYMLENNIDLPAWPYVLL